MREYPKTWMKRGELEELGISRVLLDRAYHSPGQTFATKVSPLKSNSVILFDTEEFEKWRYRTLKTK